VERCVVSVNEHTRFPIPICPLRGLPPIPDVG
jgi:hypothetical protein